MNWIEPMEPISCIDVKENPEYTHEVKWDGIRGLVYLSNSELKIYTKKGKDRTAFYPELSELYREFKGNNIILDGEIVVFDKRGFPSFYSSLTRETVKNQKNLKYYQKNYPINYMVFDVLQYKDKLLTNLPLFERRQLLEKVLKPITGRNSAIHLSEMHSDGKELFQKMKEQNMEGIVSKKTSSFYISGKKHEAWFKTKFTKKMLCIIGGIQWKGDKPNSLVLGVKTAENGKMNYVGKASLGLKEADLKLLKEYKDELSQEECPFTEGSISAIDVIDGRIMWVAPIITCWINFLELSNNGHFRHPKIIGFTNLPIEQANGRVLTE